jgi:hypothetical protein
MKIPYNKLNSIFTARQLGFKCRKIMTYDDIDKIDPDFWAKVRSETEAVIRLSQVTGMTATECSKIIKDVNVGRIWPYYA